MSNQKSGRISPTAIVVQIHLYLIEINVIVVCCLVILSCPTSFICCARGFRPVKVIADAMILCYRGNHFFTESKSPKFQGMPPFTGASIYHEQMIVGFVDISIIM